MTPKQEQFAQLVANGMSQSDAYRAAYDTSDSSDKTIHEEASRLANHPKVSPRIAEIQAEIRESLKVSKASLTRELDEARMVAAAKEHGSAMVAATMGKAKLHGIGIENVNHSGGVVVQSVPWEAMYEDGDIKPGS